MHLPGQMRPSSAEVRALHENMSDSLFWQDPETEADELVKAYTEPGHLHSMPRLPYGLQLRTITTSEHVV